MATRKSVKRSSTKAKGGKPVKKFVELLITKKTAAKKAKATEVPEPVVVAPPQPAAPVIITVTDLLGSNPRFVRLPTLQVPGRKTPWGDEGGYLFKDDRLVVDSAQPYDTGTKYVRCRVANNMKQTLTVIMPDDFKMEVLVGEAKAQLEKIFAESIKDNFTSLIFYGGNIGSDPEIFIEDDRSQMIPAFNFLKPKGPTADLSAGPAGYNKPIYWDGFQAEFETYAPGCLAFHVDSVQYGLKSLLQLARKHNPNAKLSMKTVMDIPEELLATSAEEHVALGCMPSFNAYGLKGLEVPGRQLHFRSAGGHIHFGIGKRGTEDMERIVKALDAILGVACVSLFATFDNPKRRAMYGLPGEYRLPPHGLEYRTLSNAWLCHPLIMNIVFDLARKVVGLGSIGGLGVWDATEEETINIIRSCDVAKAREVLDRNKNVMVQLLNLCYAGGGERIFNVYRNGVESVIQNPNDIEGNWLLNGKWIAHCDSPGKNAQKAIQIIGGGAKVA